MILAAQVHAQDLPRQTGALLYDFASLMTTDEAAETEAKLRELGQERGIEFVVITIASMADYGHQAAIEPFATNWFNTWGLGDATRNDGVMFLVAHDDRVMRIEVGAGYGDSKNDAMAAIIDEVIKPHFRDDDYARGIDRGVDAIVHEISGVWPGEFNASFIEKLWNPLTRLLDRIGDWIAIAYAFFAGLAYRGYRKWKRNRPRICPRDGSKMQRLGEAADDAFLQPGERVEERLKSVDYDVWECGQCGHRKIEAYKSWFSNYSACRSCNFRTLEGDSSVVTAATTSSEGLRRIDYNCKNCGDTYHTHATIPKVSKSSSSSSSGGSSGGGSSSGGGASGSW
ncbi:TPM domain-containing protein [Cognatishimia sp. SS12]|nr:TPM domain-containing protein [Cognatishimia sp. SS12]